MTAHVMVALDTTDRRVPIVATHVNRWFAVHRDVRSDGTLCNFGWTITHRPTGWAAEHFIPTRSRAITFARRLTRLRRPKHFTWDFTDPMAVRKWPEAQQLMARARNPR